MRGAFGVAVQRLSPRGPSPSGRALGAWPGAAHQLRTALNTFARISAHSGINALIFKGAAIEQGFGTQNWVTFRQAFSLGGKPWFRTLVEASRREAERISSHVLTLKIED
jgi:N-terminal domain of anti-restriction factor ArdC